MMMVNEIIGRWEHSRGPIKRRWARSIGPYGGLVKVKIGEGHDDDG
jgi:hypothetical protein